MAAEETPRGFIDRIYFGDHKILLYTKYAISGPYGFRGYFKIFALFMSTGKDCAWCVDM